MRILFPTLLLIFCFSSQNIFSQISIKDYKQSENQTFYINTDTSSQKFNAKTLKKPIKTSPNLSYTWYKSNQLFTLQGGVDGRVLDGEYSSYYKNNSLKSKGQYKNGIKIKTWYEWSQDGKLKQVSNWKKGLKSGLTTSYDNGRILKTERYKSNFLNGKSIEYESNNNTITYYKKGAIDVERMKSLAQSNTVTQPKPALSSQAGANQSKSEIKKAALPKRKSQNKIAKNSQSTQIKKP